MICSRSICILMLLIVVQNEYNTLLRLIHQLSLCFDKTSVIIKRQTATWIRTRVKYLVRYLCKPQTWKKGEFIKTIKMTIFLYGMFYVDYIHLKICCCSSSSDPEVRHCLYFLDNQCMYYYIVLMLTWYLIYSYIHNLHLHTYTFYC